MGRGQVNESKGQVRLDPVTRRALLVEAAAAVFHGRDPSEVGFEEVAEAAGVSRSLVYNYFGDRAGLTAAVYVHEVEQLDRQLRRAADRKIPVEVRLRRIVRRYLVFARDNPDVWNLITSIGSLPHPAIQEARRARITAIANSWGRGPRSELIVCSVMGYLEHGAQHWLDTRQCSLDFAAKQLYGMLWTGLSGARVDAVLPPSQAAAAGR